METIIVTFNAVITTVFWFIIFIISYGWQINRELFTRNELKNLIVVFLVIYILICFDQIFDMILPQTLFNLKSSDYKNIVVYTVFSIVCIKYSLGTRKTLKSRYNYAYNFSREYMPSIKLKIQMIRNHIIGVINCYIFFLISLVLRKIVLANSITVELKLLIELYAEFIAFVFFLVTYYPRKFPRNFNVYYDAESYDTIINNVDSHIFKVKFLYQSGDLIQEDLTKREMKEFNNNRNMPYIILNPFYEDIKSDLNNSSVFKTSQVLEHIVIGRR